MAIRLKDIAADLGISAVTVSKVLRGKPDISQETRRRVLERVRAVNYQPNLLARGLASGKSMTVGLIVPDLVHPFFTEFAKGLKAGLRKRGYQLILASAEEEPELEREEMDTLLARGVDALLLATCQAQEDALASLTGVMVPCVLVDRALPDSGLPFVGTDDVAAGRLATEHLLGLGRQRIAHITGEGFSTAYDRLTGYCQALTAAGIEPQPSWIVHRLRLEQAGEVIGAEAMDELLALPERPDAVFCLNDLAAVGVTQAVLAAGLRVPEDIAVVGCGNLRQADYLRVPLTSIDQSTLEQGELAARLTVALLGGATKMPEREVRVSPRLIARTSTGTSPVSMRQIPSPAHPSTVRRDTMSANVEHGPSSETEINPKLSSDIHYWSKQFGVDGQVLHEAIRVHGQQVAKVKAALEAKHAVTSPQHDKAGA